MEERVNPVANDLFDLTHYHTMPHFDTPKIYIITVENIVRKEKLLVTSNFSFSHNIFYSIWHLFFILNAL